VTGPRLETLQEWLEAAELFARAAGDLTLHHFGGVLAAEAKGDGSPVTVADREAEALLRERIRSRFPGHGILGEEFGEEGAGSAVRWILDPIDGTRSFMRGVPLYGVLIGIEADGEAVVGVAHFPALQGEMVSAARGRGCSWNGRPCSVSRTRRLEEAALLTTDPERVLASPGTGPGWRRLCRRASVTRSWGDAWGHALVATGRAEVMVDPVLSSWDAAPLLTILQEAGGRFTDLQGRPGIHGGSGVSSNGILHDAILAELRAG
jgi:histidinol-phosphatase